MLFFRFKIYLLTWFKSCPLHNNIDLILSFFLNPEIFKNLKVPSALKTYNLKPGDLLKNSMVLSKPFFEHNEECRGFHFFFLFPYIRKHCFYIGLCVGLKLPGKNLQLNSPVLKKYLSSFIRRHIYSVNCH